ncbi:MAG: zinc ribbon domain-containing protein [Gaiellaceae bacterium]
MSTPAERACPRCGAPHEPGQEYCLECGYRLQAAPGVVGRLSAAWQRRFGWYPGDWFWRVLLGLVIAIAGATAAIALTDAGAENTTIVATQGGGPAHTPTTAPQTATVTLPSVSTAAGPPPTPSTAPPATTTAPAPGSLTSWPTARSGFTVVLESIPTSAGRSLAFARARAASRAGLPQVGVLDSGRYSSLHPGYYVVFSGIYTSAAQAETARAAAAEKGFQLAYSREITR